MGVWAEDKTLTFVFNSSEKDVITGNDLGTAYTFHRWTVSNNDVTVYLGGKNGVQSKLIAMRYAAKYTGEMFGNIDPTYDDGKGYNIPTGAVGAIPGRIKNISVVCGGTTSRGIYVYAGTKQIVGDETAPNGTGFYDVKSTKRTGANVSVDYDASTDYRYFAITGASSSYSAISSVTITYEGTSTPSITASDVKYAADKLKGEIYYTINNAEGSTLVPSVPEGSWISNLAVDAENSKVTFDMTENMDEANQREEKITLTYGNLTTDVKVTQFAAVAKRLVTIETPANGTLKMFRGEEEVLSGARIPVGTELRAEATPAPGYKFRNWQADDGTIHTYTTNFTYTIGESDVTFSATFDPIVYHTITWSVNGTETTEQVEEGQAITFTDSPAGIPDGYVFTGWYADEYFSTTAPTYVTSATADADKKYYAVFAKSSGGGSETATLTASHTTADTNYGSHPYTDDKGGDWVTVSNQQGTGEDARFGLTKNDKNPYFGSPEFPGKVTKIEMSVYNGSSSKDRNFYIDSQETSQSGDLGTINVAGNEKFVVKTATLKGSEFNKFYVHASDALSFKYIAVTYSNEVLSDFRTSLTAPTTATITLSEACKDADGFYYGTYSNSKPFVVSEDIIVAEISVIDGKLLVDEYNPGDIVPANTGVMVCSDVAGDHTVNLSTEPGTSIPGGNNMLRPTGDAGITAADMAAADANCKYYRLTMHKGTTLGFFWGAADGAAFNVAANKAYLAVPQEIAQKIQSFVIGDGGTTSIDGITTDGSENAQRTVYNLQGQRVSPDAAHGLYIVNGKKVIIR